MSNRSLPTKDENVFVIRRQSSAASAVYWRQIVDAANLELLRWFEPLCPILLDALVAGEHVIELR